MYDKKIFAGNLLRMMDERGDSQADIARLLGVSKSTVSSYCAATQIPRMDKIEQLAAHFCVNKSALIEDNSLPVGTASMPALRRLPRVGRIACGEPVLAEQNIESYDAVPDWVSADFTLVCKGDSMIGAHIRDGDVVCIRRQEEVQSGQIAAVLVDDETESGSATLKRVRYIDGGVALWPENPAYAPMIFYGADAARVHILGLATHFISAVR